MSAYMAPIYHPYVCVCARRACTHTHVGAHAYAQVLRKPRAGYSWVRNDIWSTAVGHGELGPGVYARAASVRTCIRRKCMRECTSACRCGQALACGRVGMHLHVCICASRCMRAGTCMHACVQACVRAHVHARACICAWIESDVDDYLHAYTHAHCTCVCARARVSVQLFVLFTSDSSVNRAGFTAS